MEGPSKAEISCTDNQDGTCSVSYLPVLPGDYSIVVKYNDKHIPGSPFTARITGTGGLRARGGLRVVLGVDLKPLRGLGAVLGVPGVNLRVDFEPPADLGWFWGSPGRVWGTPPRCFWGAVLTPPCPRPRR